MCLPPGIYKASRDNMARIIYSLFGCLYTFMLLFMWDLEYSLAQRFSVSACVLYTILNCYKKLFALPKVDT